MFTGIKLMMMGIVFLYVISPLDFFPEPIDDILVIIGSLIANKVFF